MWIRRIMCVGLVAVVAGCAANTPPSNFYILNSLYSTGAKPSFVPSTDGLKVGFGPMALPDHLDRPQIVTRADPNKLTIDEFHRWGGELDSDVKRVMAQNLSYLLNSDQVQVYPWPASMQVDYQVLFTVIRMDGILGKRAVIRARWQILKGEDGRQLASSLSTRVEPVSGPGYRALVAAQSRALQAIAADISGKITELGGAPR